jgi:hypothetical protein
MIYQLLILIATYLLQPLFIRFNNLGPLGGQFVARGLAAHLNLEKLDLRQVLLML